MNSFIRRISTRPSSRHRWLILDPKSSVRSTDRSDREKKIFWINSLDRSLCFLIDCNRTDVRWVVRVDWRSYSDEYYDKRVSESGLCTSFENHHNSRADVVHAFTDRHTNTTFHYRFSTSRRILRRPYRLKTQKKQKKNKKPPATRARRRENVKSQRT